MWYYMINGIVRYGKMEKKMMGEYGKKMLRLGVEYVREKLTASRIDLGVFENNEKARRCYEVVGFKAYSKRACEMPIGTWSCTDMELILDAGR